MKVLMFSVFRLSHLYAMEGSHGDTMGNVPWRPKRNTDRAEFSPEDNSVS